MSSKAELEELHKFFQPIKFRIIAVLKREGELYIKQIAEALGEDRELVTYHLKGLEEAGFVTIERKNAPFKGQIKVYKLTEKIDKDIKPKLEKILA